MGCWARPVSQVGCTWICQFLLNSFYQRVWRSPEPICSQASASGSCWALRPVLIVLSGAHCALVAHRKINMVSAGPQQSSRSLPLAVPLQRCAAGCTTPAHGLQCDTGRQRWRRAASAAAAAVGSSVRRSASGGGCPAARSPGGLALRAARVNCLPRKCIWAAAICTGIRCERTSLHPPLPAGPSPRCFVQQSLLCSSAPGRDRRL